MISAKRLGNHPLVYEDANKPKFVEAPILDVGEDNLEFQKLWEIVMIRSTSEAICETVGSMMN